ncbi:Sodium/calcium exchanger protein-domain-containing protein [Xylaria bambusicola]|uniref:Sodium/calcium exchanger protein-domain-containing protein n=1 Tax=Xylaria bambusicola TaxID=326684 RepID=UPI002007D158|nr:Sodium/calcium exchanger protein-domain-containing protein [Xylaria bambusicola]KAI0523909.1 Sodium/calcium exchanger protein-domain-containing protein [Xylaria bambusicola]
MAATTTNAFTGNTSILRRRRAFDTRPLYTTIFIFTFLAVYSLVIKKHYTTYASASAPAPAPAPLSASTRYRHDQRSLASLSDEDCRLVHYAPDQCAFVKRNCRDEEAGLVEYLTFYYCSLGRVQPLAFIILVLWLGLLFTTIGIAASDFFSVNLSTISTFLGLSESLAGVTFLAFGNGSPDVFSTFAAMGSNSGSMAVGELIGAAGFITTVVAGSMALVREFRVARKTFIRDICFFIIAVGFAVGFLIDGQLHFAECLVMIGFYVFYVAVVVGWHAYTKKRSARRAKEAAARAHFYRTTGDSGNDELEPYRDAPDDDEPSTTRSGSAPIDIEALERTPLIEIGSTDGDGDDHSDQNQHVAAEVTSSMRVNRPRGRRSNTTITPIRPSLVGALEFRSILASLQREGNVRMRPIHTRTYSTISHLHVTPHSAAQEHALLSPSTDDGETSQATRNRALSSGDMPVAIDQDIAQRQLAPPHTIGGRLAPPPLNDRLSETSSLDNESEFLTPTLYQPRTSPSNSERSTPQLSPFPDYTDSPLVMTPTQPPSFLTLPSPVVEPPSTSSSLTGPTGPKPVKWWPYGVLPPPHIMLSTLFPTLQSWRTKSIWDKFLSIISLPSIFLLVITLPVVETESTHDDHEEIVVDQPSVPSVAIEVDEPTETETEWQRYRRSTISTGTSRSPSPSPSRTNPDDSRIAIMGAETPIAPIQPTIEVHPPKPPSSLGQDTSTIVDEDQGWNRWLLILQIFIGPLFCVLIVWANLAEDLENPIKVLVRSLLISLVSSLVLLALLLMTTSPNSRPKYHVAFCFLGFIIAIAWISTVAGEVVGVMKAFGVILDISEAILGLTIFAVGNSVGDLVADVTVARLGYPVMALSACFGGPLLNILLGIGLGGAYQTISAANKHHAKHPDKPYHYKPYHIQVTGTLMVSTIALLITLFALLVVVPMNKWMMTRKIGWSLIGLWTASTVLNLVIEVTGVWQDVA